MSTKAHITPEVRPHDVKVPPSPKPLPPGTSQGPSVPRGIERKAQEFVHEAGSVRRAKKAIDSAAEMENASNFREDLLAMNWGFSSRKEMLAASKPIQDSAGASWWATRIPAGAWTVWNQITVQSDTCESLEQAKQSLLASQTAEDNPAEHKTAQDNTAEEPGSPPPMPEVFLG